MVEKMVDDQPTTSLFHLWAKDIFISEVDPDKMSTIILVNKVMKLVYKREMIWMRNSS